MATHPLTPSTAARALITSILLLLAACVPGGFTQSRAVPDYHTGTKGLELNVLPNAPPPTTYEGDTIPFVVEAHNQGATDVDGGVYALGIEETIVETADDRTGTFDLSGRNEFTPEGGKTRHSFALKTRPLDPQTETYTTTISYTACYPYQTTGSATVCIDPDILNEQRNKPCKPGSASMGSGQGAPVSIGKIESRMLTHQDKTKIIPEFTISLSNAQRGVVVATSETERACSSQPLTPNTIGVVQVTGQLGDQQLTCQPRADEKARAATVKLGTGTTIRCTLPEGVPKTRGTYTTILQIAIDYGYTTTISKQVQIKRR